MLKSYSRLKISSHKRLRTHFDNMVRRDMQPLKFKMSLTLSVPQASGCSLPNIPERPFHVPQVELLGTHPSFADLHARPPQVHAR